MMKNSKILVILIFVLPLIISTTFAQSGGISPKNQQEKPTPKEREKGQYEDFEITSENVGWVKEQIRKERELADKEHSEGKISDAEFEARLEKIRAAERKVKEFEESSSILVVPQDDDETSANEGEAGQTPGELVSKKEKQDKQNAARLERERKKKEANRAKADAQRIETKKENIKKEKERLNKAKREGKISEKDYNEQMARLNQTEKRILEREQNPKKSGNTKEVKPNEVDGRTRGVAKKDDIKMAEEQVKKAEIHKEKSDKELERSLSEGEKKIADAKIRVQKQKQQLDRDKKSGKINQQYYDQKMLKIKKVEAAISDLENDVNKGKALEEAR